MFCISLDYELAWGLDRNYIDNGYIKNLKNAKHAANEIFETLNRYNVKATWGCVGLLYTQDHKAQLKNISNFNYSNHLLSQKNIIEIIDQYNEDIFYGGDLLSSLKMNPNHEIASHSFSHLYHLEDGINKNDIERDIELFSSYCDESVISMIFPRNQIDEDFLKIYKDFGYKAYRGCYPHWAYISGAGKDNYIKRLFRLLDHYIPITSHSVALNSISNTHLKNIPGTCFLKPISNFNSLSTKIRLKNIQVAINKAAASNNLFHLWWHPHNFGSNLGDNILFLTKVLEYFLEAKETYNMKSYTIGELASKLNQSP